VGCGLDGQKVARLASHCHLQVALDHEFGMLTEARRACNTNKVILIAADAFNLPFQSDSVDHVVALGLFAYVNDSVLVFREFRRVCHPDGHVMITNSVSRPKEKHRAAGIEAGFTLIDEAEGYCPRHPETSRDGTCLFLQNLVVRPTGCGGEANQAVNAQTVAARHNTKATLVLHVCQAGTEWEPSQQDFTRIR
jgi:SAM-dependent methyltransferase